MKLLTAICPSADHQVQRPRRVFGGATVLRRRLRPAIFAGVGVAFSAWTSPAWAGMPSISFSDAARLRLNAISFFLAAFVLSAAVMLWVWNYLRRDFTWLPRLSFGRACLAVAVWGFLFVIVLTMISGARELMTPGAWKKKTYTYELAKEPGDEDRYEVSERRERSEALLRLGKALDAYAADHDGVYPPAEDPSIPAELWRMPGIGGLKYVYCPGRTQRDGRAPLAYERSFEGGTVCVLLASGQTAWEDFDNVARAAQSRDH